MIIQTLLMWLDGFVTMRWQMWNVIFPIILARRLSTDVLSGSQEKTVAAFYIWFQTDYVFQELLQSKLN